MFEAAFDGMMMVLAPESMLFMLIGVLVGTFTGAMPGLTGTITLAMLIPFAIKLNMINAMCLLLGSHVAVEFGGSVSAVLINTPGTGQAVATCFDGYEMAKKGEAARAISVAATSSGLGGIIGFVVLVLSLPVLKVIVLALAAPEYFVLAFVGLTFIALLGGKSIYKGLAAGGLGLMTSMIGLDPVASVERFAFGWLYLWDGIDLIAVVVGFFAFAEMLELMRQGGEKSIARTDIKVLAPFAQVWLGIKDTFRCWWITLICSIQGVIIGIIPGLGGSVANIMAYATAQRLSKHPELYGTGIPEGVAAPEAANNSKEGGALIPTLAFGIPGSAGMAIFLTIFIMMGIAPGPELLTKNLDFVFAMCWILAIANVLSTAIGYLTAAGVSRFTFVPNRYLVPVVMALAGIGAFISGDNIGGVVIAVIFGFVGYAFKRFGYPKAPFIVGLVLGVVVERYLHLAIKLYTPYFFMRPICLIIIILTLGFGVYQAYKSKRAEGKKR